MRRWTGWWLLLLFLLPFAVAARYSILTDQTVVREASQLQITVRDGKNEWQMGVTDYLTGVVAGQMDAEYEMETLKAQAIIARSCLYARAGNRTYIESAETGMAWISETKRRLMWGIRYEANNEKVRQAVQATEGLVLRYEGQLIEPAFFSLSSGCTRSSLEAWGTEVPWLQSVESAWDREAESYETILTMTRRQVIAALKKSFPDFNCDADSLASTCQITQTDSAGYVMEMQIGNKLLSGDDLRYALGLPSGCFQIAFSGNTVTLTTSGIGHGVGFDQYGANRQALEGKSCEQLLTYYLTGVKVGE